MDIIKLLECFKDFLYFPVPLGIDILVILLIFILFYRLQNNRRKDYVTSLNHSSETNKLLQKTIKDKEKTIKNRENRIYKLEARLDSFQTNHKGGR